MAFTLQKQPDAPIIVYIQHPGDNPMQDVPTAMAEVGRLLDEQAEPVFLMSDIRSVKLNLDDMIQAASMGARGSNAVLHHPMIRENVYVITDSVMKMSLKGLTSATFGMVKLSHFDTLDEALAYCHDRLAAEGRSGASKEQDANAG